MLTMKVSCLEWLTFSSSVHEKEEMESPLATCKRKQLLTELSLRRLLNNAVQRLAGNVSSLSIPHVRMRTGSSNSKQPSWNRYRRAKLLFLIVALFAASFLMLVRPNLSVGKAPVLRKAVLIL